MGKEIREIGDVEMDGKNKVKKPAVESERQMDDNYDVVVVGGGISGLVAGYDTFLRRLYPHPLLRQRRLFRPASSKRNTKTVAPARWFKC